MPSTLRQLLIQRAARLQERPAVTTSAWGTLTWTAWRNRVEGIALGLMATPRPVGDLVYATGQGPWDWAAEVAAACCGLQWNESGERISEAVLGGAAFNAEAGRGAYHDRESHVLASTPFREGLTHATFLHYLQAWNRRLGWDHTSTVPFPQDLAGSPEGRAALWCALYAGAHAQFLAPIAPAKGLRRWFPPPPPPTLSLEIFSSFGSE